MIPKAVMEHENLLQWCEPYLDFDQFVVSKPYGGDFISLGFRFTVVLDPGEIPSHMWNIIASTPDVGIIDPIASEIETKYGVNFDTFDYEKVNAAVVDLKRELQALGLDIGQGSEQPL